MQQFADLLKFRRVVGELGAALQTLPSVLWVCGVGEHDDGASFPVLLYDLEHVEPLPPGICTSSITTSGLNRRTASEAWQRYRPDPNVDTLDLSTASIKRSTIIGESSTISTVMVTSIFHCQRKQSLIRFIL